MVSVAWYIQPYINMMATIFLFALLQNYGNSVDCVTYSNTNAKEKGKCILWIVVALFYTRNISYNNACIEIQKKSFIRGIFLYYRKNFFGDIPFRFELYHLSYTIKRFAQKELLHLWFHRLLNTKRV